MPQTSRVLIPILALLSVAPLAAQRSVPDQPKTTSRESLRADLAAAKIQLADAVRKALERVPGAALRATLESVRVDGRLAPRFEVEILKDDAFYEVQVDALSGEIVRVEAVAAPAAARLGEMVFDFEKEELPFGFEIAEMTDGAPKAKWRTERVEDAPQGKRAATVEAAGARMAFNLLLRRGSVAPDATISVRLQAWKGKEDQGGGIVWRAKDAKNYYVARWNPLETNLRFYTVKDGKRSTPLKSVEIDADAKAWHVMSVTTIGPKVVVRFNDKIVLEAEDATFAEGGAVGLWTKADASTRFDELRVLPR